MADYGACSVCGRRVALIVTSGKTRVHSKGRRQGQCVGSQQPPAPRKTVQR